MVGDRYDCPWCHAEVADDAWRCLYCGGLRPRTILVGVVSVLVVAAVVVWFVT